MTMGVVIFRLCSSIPKANHGVCGGYTAPNCHILLLKLKGNIVNVFPIQFICAYAYNYLYLHRMKHKRLQKILKGEVLTF